MDLSDAGTGLANQTSPSLDEILGPDIDSNLIQAGLLFSLIFSLTGKAFPKTSNTFNRTYDYIIVGGGPGGSVLANRLTELPWISVLLLEAGGKGPLLTEIPSFARVFYGTNVDWLYQTVPQKYGAYSQIDQVGGLRPEFHITGKHAETENRIGKPTHSKVNWNSGKGLGGGSIINAMLYVRGNKKNYDDWEAQGATGWSYKDVLPYFKKMEDNKDIDELDKGYHAQGGPVTVEKPNYDPEIRQPIIDALQKLGFKLTDVNGKRQTGIYDLQGFLRNLQRCSAAKSYLVPAEDRPNLTILKGAFGKRIIFRGNKAIGVEFDFEGKSNKVRARREVIISSGTVRAPQILMLSGVGPKDRLDELGIPVVADRPGVGQNLQDHCSANVNFEINPTIPNVVVKNLNPVNIMKYRDDREGPLTAPTQVTVMLFSNGLNNSDSVDFPRQELYFAEYVVEDALKDYNIDPVIYAKVFGKYTERPTYTCLVSILQPRSRGEIRLASTDPYEYPLIDPHYYEVEDDLWDVVEGMKICKAVGESKEMKESVQSKMLDETYPNCVGKTGNITEYFACQARQLITSFWHPVGTCRMGRRSDRFAVVDPHLKVIGTRNLRVVCAAVMPIIPSGNTNIPTAMVSEKIADEMKKELMREAEQSG